MFILKSFHIENFMSIDSADFDFASSQITSISGPNGSGKSSFIDAIAFVLTGHRKGESVKNYVKAGTDTAKLVLDATFIGDPIHYEIEIYNSLKHPQPTNKKIDFRGKIYLNSDCNQFTKEFKLEELESLMFMFQGSNEIIESKPAERASILKKLFKFEFPEIVETLRTKQDEQKQESIEHNAVLNELKSRSFEKLPLMRETAPVNITNWENRLNEIDDSLALIGDTDEQELNKVNSDLESAQKALLTLDSNLSTTRYSLTKLQDQVKDIEFFLSSYNLETLQKDVDKAKQDIAQHDIDYSNQRESFDKMNEGLSVLQYKEKELSNQYEISKTGVCHACGQPIEKEHIDKLKQDLESTSKSIIEKKKEITSLDFDKRDLKGKELKKNLTTKEDLIKKYNNEVKSKETILVRINDLSNLITERENSYKEINHKISMLLERKDKLSQMIGLITEKNNLLAEQKEVKDKLQTARDNHIKNLERKASNEKMLKNEEERDQRVRDINDKINNLAKDSDKIKKELEIFENGLPNFIVLQACQRIEDIINSIVQKVFPYCRVSLKLSRGGVNFFYTSESSEEEWIPVSMASGCQKMILSLSYFIALARLSGITCIFLDEIDASMSAENAAIVYDFIAGLEGFDQVFFISHRPEASEAVKEKNDKLITYYVTNGNYTEI